MLSTRVSAEEPPVSDWLVGVQALDAILLLTYDLLSYGSDVLFTTTYLHTVH